MKVKPLRKIKNISINKDYLKRFLKNWIPISLIMIFFAIVLLGIIISYFLTH